MRSAGRPSVAALSAAMLRSAICAELIVGQMAILVVARRAEIGAIDLQQEPGFDDGLVFDFASRRRARRHRRPRSDNAD